jgi:hypothetical protein
MATPPVFTAGQVLTAAQMNKVGLWEVYPQTAVSGVNTITRDGVFTSDFTNYLLIITGTNASSGNMNIQFRVGGVTASTNYNAQFLYVSSTTISGSRTNGSTSWTTGTIGPETNSSFTNIYGPQIAAVTAITSSNYYAGNTTTAERQEWFGNHSTATAYDGFIITASAGTFTGNYALYGYNK